MANITLTDLRDRFAGNTPITTILEVLNETNDVVSDMSLMEANGTTQHTSVLRSELPAPSWRALGEGVPATKSGTVQIRDVMGELSDLIRMDQRLLDLAPDREAFLAQELAAHLEGFAQEVATSIFYSNVTSNPRAILGLAPRYNTLSTSEPISDFVLDAGGTGSNLRSIWIIDWDTRGVTGIYPRGTAGGIERKPLQSDTVTDSNGNEYPGYKLWLAWTWGIHVADYRHAVRIANINPSTFGTTSAPDLPKLINEAFYRVKNPGNAKLYASIPVLSEIRRQYAEKLSQSTLQYVDINGTRYQATPEGFILRQVDALRTSEAQVV